MTDLPKCRYCDETLSRWGWFETDDEPYEFWICLPCDRDTDRGWQAIQVLPRRIKRKD